MTTFDLIQERLTQALNPTSLHINDESGKHAHHRGAKEQPGAGHYELTIVSEAFVGKSRLERHRLIYSALGELMQGAIHALKIDAKAPNE